MEPLSWFVCTVLFSEGSEQLVLNQSGATTTSETPVVPPGQEIPQSLLVHDDITSPEKTQHQQDVGEKANVKDTPEKFTINNKSPEELRQTNTTNLVDNGEKCENTKDDSEKSNMTSPVKTTDELKDENIESQSPDRKSAKLLKATEDSSKDTSPKVRTRSGSKLKEAKHLKQESEKVVKEDSKDSKSPSKKVKPTVNVEMSPRRPKRTSQLPARLAESELFIKRKMTLSSVDSNSSEAKRVKIEVDENVPTETAGNINRDQNNSQGSEKLNSSVSSSPLKVQKKRKGNKEKSEDTSDDIEDVKFKSEKTLPCPVCKQLMKEWENVFDHFKKQHTNHKEYEVLISELKVRYSD